MREGASLYTFAQKVTFKDSFKCKFCSYSTNSSEHENAHDARAPQARAHHCESCSFKITRGELASACCGRHASVELTNASNATTQPS